MRAWPALFALIVLATPASAGVGDAGVADAGVEAAGDDVPFDVVADAGVDGDGNGLDVLEQRLRTARGRERALAEAHLVVAQTRRDQASWRAALAERRAHLSAEEAAWQADTARFEAAVAALDDRNQADDDDASRHYDGLVAALTARREALRATIAEVARAPAAPRPVVDLDAPTAVPPALRDEAAALAIELDALEVEATALDRDQREALIAHSARTAASLDALNALRLRTLPHLPPGRRDALLGYGAEGRAQLGREVEHAVLVARYLWQVEAPTLRDRARSIGALAVGRISLQALATLAVIIVAVVVARRGRRWLESLKVVTAHHFGRSVTTRAVVGIAGVLDAIWSPLVLVLAVFAVGVVDAPLRERAGGAILFGLLEAWALLRLVVAITHRLIRWLARPQVGALQQVHSDKAFASVRFVGRAALVLYTFLHATEALVGRGSLYTSAVRVGVIATIPVALVLIRRWQDDIADAYLRLFPRGRLAILVADARGRWYGFFVVVAAFAFVFGSALVAVAGRFVLNFDQTRKALAFVFRARLERRAREQVATEPMRPLPDEVTRALRPGPAIDEVDVIPERLVGLDDARAAFARWRDGDEATVGAVLVVGAAGVGRTTWLQAFARDLGFATSTLTLTTRPASPAGFIDALGDALGLDRLDGPADDDGLGGLIAAIRSGPRRVLCIDDLQHVWLRGATDRRCWQVVSDLIAGVGDHLFVVATMTNWTWRHIEWAEPGHQRFRLVVELPPWTEGQIHRLLSRRTAASAHEVLYDDLVIAAADLENREVQLLSTAQEYTRLLWDFADGDPVAALDAWQRSLHPVSHHKLRVRLFRRPDDAVLDALDDTGRFGLAAVVWNDVVTAGDAARALHLPQRDVDDVLRRLGDEGVLERRPGGWRVTPRWRSVVPRFLRRKHLLAAD
jgi:hypothetical protein